MVDKAQRTGLLRRIIGALTWGKQSNEPTTQPAPPPKTHGFDNAFPLVKPTADFSFASLKIPESENRNDLGASARREWNAAIGLLQESREGLSTKSDGVWFTQDHEGGISSDFFHHEWESVSVRETTLLLEPPLDPRKPFGQDGNNWKKSYKWNYYHERGGPFQGKLEIQEKHPDGHLSAELFEYFPENDQLFKEKIEVWSRTPHVHKKLSDFTRKETTLIRAPLDAAPEIVAERLISIIKEEQLE